MKKIKSINGYTIFQHTARDEKNGLTAGEFSIYFSSDIRDYGRENSYPEFEGIETIEICEELCENNLAIAKEICEAKSTCVSFEEIEEIEKKLDAGATAEEIEETEEIENDLFIDYLNNTDWIDTEIIINDMESEFSFVWSNDYIFNDYGIEKFKSILFCGYSVNDGYIEVYSDASENLIDLFNSTIAGYISEKEYNNILVKREV